MPWPTSALEMQSEIVKVIPPCGKSFSLRVGVNTGPTVAGFIGKTKFTYDISGETVATASEMSTLGAPGNIQVNETTEANLRDKYIFEERGQYYIKDKGTVRISFLMGKKRENQ
jgi:class 3 adenylate cyclase